MFLYAFVTVYIVLKSIKMGESDLDNVSSSEKIVDFKKMDRVNLSSLAPIVNFATKDPTMLDYIDVEVKQYKKFVL